jgi:hypothetical protein
MEALRDLHSVGKVKAVMRKYDGQKIEILNWEKYNPRRDIKASSWFRMDHLVFEDPKFYELGPECWGVLMYLFCQASKSSQDSRGCFVINYKHAMRCGQFPPKVLDVAIEKLIQSQFLTVHVTPTNADERARTDAYADVRTSTHTLPTGRDGTERDVTGHAEAKQSFVHAFSTDAAFGQFLQGIKSELFEAWEKLYPSEWIKTEVLKAIAWCAANPARAPKGKTNSKFINNWLANGWESYRKTLPSNPTNTGTMPKNSVAEKARLAQLRKEMGLDEALR